MALSIKEGEPLCKYDGDEIIRVSQKPHDGEMDLEKIADIIERWLKKHNTTIDVKKLKQYLLNDDEPPKKEKKMRKIWKQITDELNNKAIEVDKGEMLPCFNKKDPEGNRKVFYISGMSGSGKSTLASKIVKDYHKEYPRNRVLLFSNKDTDPAFDKLDYLRRIELSEDLVEEPINLEELRNSLIIFDDTEFVKSKPLAKELERIANLILQQGRSFKINMIFITHQLTNYKETRIILNEATSITCFPNYTNLYTLKRVFKLYFGFTDEDVQRLIDTQSRWVCISKMPKAVIYDRGCYLY